MSVIEEEMGVTTVVISPMGMSVLVYVGVCE